MARPVAAFDIDGTVFRSSLLIELMDALVEREILPAAATQSYRRARERWENEGAGYDLYIAKAIESFRKHAKGIPYGLIADVGGEIIEAKKGHTYRYARERIAALKNEGYFLLAVSRSPKFMVDGFGYELGFDKSYGVFFDTGASGRFTGEIIDEHVIMNKGLVLQRAVKKEKLTFKGSVAVGDTESDIPLLELVDEPIAFNPSKGLLRRARQHDWKVVIERKDAIYEL